MSECQVMRVHLDDKKACRFSVSALWFQVRQMAQLSPHVPKSLRPICAMARAFNPRSRVQFPAATPNTRVSV